MNSNSKPSASNDKRCPECWSAVTVAATVCESCGYRLTGGGSKRWFWGVGLVAVMAGGTAIAWPFFQQTSNKPAPPTTKQPDLGSDEPESAGPAIKQPEGRPTTTEQAPPALLLLWSKDRSFPALALRTDKEPVLCVPIGLLPPRGRIAIERNKTVSLQVLHLDWQHGLAILAGDETQLSKLIPSTVQPVTIQQATMKPGRAVLVATAGSQQARRDAVKAGWGVQLSKSQSLASGTTVFDDKSAVAMVSQDGGVPQPLAPLQRWLMASNNAQTLAAAQAEIRKRDPKWVLDDAARLLAKDPRTLRNVRRALRILDEGRPLARDWKTNQAFDELQRNAVHNELRLTWRNDATAAIALARKGAQRFTDHPGILADLARLELQHGFGNNAAQAYQRLLQVSEKHAKTIAEPIAQGMLDLAAKRSKQQQHKQALDLLQRALQLFPQRADIHLAMAQALWRSGSKQAAIQQARTASQLDPDYQKHLRKFEERNQRGRHEIPFDPETRVITAKAKIGTQQLRFLIDTGASLTTVPSAIARNLGLLSDKNPKVKMHTASGVVEAQLVTLPFLKLGPLRARRVQAAVLDLPGDKLGGTGLLGMNVLKRWNVQIDSERGRLILKQTGRRR